MLGLALQVFGLLLTWAGVRSLAQLRLKVKHTPVLRPHPHGFHSEKSSLATLSALAKSEALTEQRLDRDYRELRFFERR